MTVILEQKRGEEGGLRTSRTAEQVGVSSRYFDGQVTTPELGQALALEQTGVWGKKTEIRTLYIVYVDCRPHSGKAHSEKATL